VNSFRRRHPDHPKYDAKRDDPSTTAERKKAPEPKDSNAPDLEMAVFAARYRKERELKYHGADVRARAAGKNKGKARHDD
jgi:hypothetical protein